MSGITNYSVVQNALLVGASNLTAGVCAWNNGSGYVAATVANKGTGRATGIALTSASTQVPAFTLQTCGWLDAATAGLAAGAAGPVRVNTTTAALERVAVPSGTDDVVGFCDTSGNCALVFGILTPGMVNPLTAPTGTGLVKVAAGVVAGAAALLVDADVNASAAIALSKTGVGTQVAPAQQYDTSIDAKGTVRTVEPKNVQTTDATVTTLDSFAVPSGSTLLVSAIVSAIKSDASQGASYIRSAAFRNNAGTVAQISTTQDGGTFEDDAAWDCTIDFTGTTARIRVTGKAATTIRWTLTHQRLEVIP